MMDDPQKPSGHQAHRDLGRSLSDISLVELVPCLSLDRLVAPREFSI
jgi:hypothetical protein